MFAEQVAKGRVLQEGVGWVDEQVLEARAEAKGERQVVLSPRRSLSDVTAVKLFVWLHHRLTRRDEPLATDIPAIF